MPTIGEIYRQLQEHEDMKKTASKKEAIANPAGGAGATSAEAIDNVIGPNVAETKVRIKAKLQEMAGGQKAVEGLSSDADDEKPSDIQAPQLGDKMPPAGDAAPKAAAAPAKAGDAEKVAAEKLAEEYTAAGRLMARGFVDELNKLAAQDGK